MSFETYFTVKNPAYVEIRIKDSRFLAHIHHSDTKENAEKIITDLSQQYASATHNCWAYRLGVGDDCNYKSDDGSEPAGTAGKPILQALETRNVSNAVLLVTRYFGGTKLGIGGLIRAYGRAAFTVLDIAELKAVEPMTIIHLLFDYKETGNVHNCLGAYQPQILDTKYSDKVKLKLSIPSKNQKKLIASLNDITHGAVEFE